MWHEYRCFLIAIKLLQLYKTIHCITLLNCGLFVQLKISYMLLHNTNYIFGYKIHLAL